MMLQFGEPGITSAQGSFIQERDSGRIGEPEMGAMSWDMLWASGWDAMVGSETMYVESVGIELPVEVYQAPI